MHLGRLLGPVGFTRTVAIKRLHPQYAADPEFVAMLLDEARLVGRIRHPNVISIIDVVEAQRELLLVMDYVHGESLAALGSAARKANTRIPPGVAVAVLSNALYGLHAAHDASDDHGQPLKIVHRDVSPQNILVGVDGVSRIFDFGVAQAAQRVQMTQDGQLKGKLPYMSPEQVRAQPLDRRSDVFAAGAVLWEALTGQRRFAGDNAASVLYEILDADVRPASSVVPGVPPQLDAIIERALRPTPAGRFATARDMAIALESALVPAIPREVGEWCGHLARTELRKRSEAVYAIESDANLHQAPNLDSDPATRQLPTTRETRIPAQATADTNVDPSAEITLIDPPWGSSVRSSRDRIDEPTIPTIVGRRSRAIPAIAIAATALVVAAAVVGVNALRNAAPSHSPVSEMSGPDLPPPIALPVVSVGALEAPMADAPSVASPSSTPSGFKEDVDTKATAPSTGTVGPTADSRPPPDSPSGAGGQGPKGGVPDDCADSPFTYTSVRGRVIKRPRPECFPK